MASIIIWLSVKHFNGHFIVFRIYAYLILTSGLKVTGRGQKSFRSLEHLCLPLLVFRLGEHVFLSQLKKLFQFGSKSDFISRPGVVSVGSIPFLRGCYCIAKPARTLHKPIEGGAGFRARLNFNITETENR